MASSLMASQKHPITFEAPRLDHEDDAEDSDSTLITRFANTIDNRYAGKPSFYKRIVVLILYYENQLQPWKELRDEINRLTSVFRTGLGWEVIECGIPILHYGLQARVNRSVADFVDDYNDPDTLLIVYYAGHGQPGDYLGALKLLGHTSPESDGEAESIQWNLTEELLMAAKSDVLEIFDCCYSSILAKHRGPDGVIEYIAATTKDTTPTPGKTSFTNALIKSLCKLKNKKSFTTEDIKNAVKDRKLNPDFSTKQIPDLSKRKNHRNSRRILLHRIEPSDKPTTSLPVPNLPATGQAIPLLRPAPATHNEKPVIKQRSVMELAFHFDQRPRTPDVVALAEAINLFKEKQDRGITNVRVKRITSRQVLNMCDVIKTLEWLKRAMHKFKQSKSLLDKSKTAVDEGAQVEVNSKKRLLTPDHTGSESGEDTIKITPRAKKRQRTGRQ